MQWNNKRYGKYYLQIMITNCINIWYSFTHWVWWGCGVFLLSKHFDKIQVDLCWRSGNGVQVTLEQYLNMKYCKRPNVFKYSELVSNHKKIMSIYYLIQIFLMLSDHCFPDLILYTKVLYKYILIVLSFSCLVMYRCMYTSGIFIKLFF